MVFLGIYLELVEHFRSFDFRLLKNVLFSGEGFVSSFIIRNVLNYLSISSIEKLIR